MKKTLLIAAAALVAGVISSEAQVYSANIVGYVNVVTPGSSQYALIANPLDDGTNNLTDLVPSAATGSTVLVWNGASYNSSTKTPTSWSANPHIAPGTGFFLRTAAIFTNTFVGNVAAAPGGGTVTNALAGGVYSLVGSAIPYSDNLASTNLNLVPATGSTVLIFNGSGYTSSTKTPTSWSFNPVIAAGQGFFVRPTVAYSWVQTLY